MAAVAELPIIKEAALPALLELVSALAKQIASLCKANANNRLLISSVEQQVQARTLELQQQNDILSMISCDAPLTDTLQALALMLETEHPEVFCSILLLDATSQTLHAGAAPSLPAAYNEALEGLAIGPTVGSCGAAAFTGQVCYAEDILTHPNWQLFCRLWRWPALEPAGQSQLLTHKVRY